MTKYNQANQTDSPLARLPGIGSVMILMLGLVARAAPIKGANGAPIKGMNNVGFQEGSSSFFYEGKAFNQVLNVAPAGINAVAGLHDVFQINMSDLAREVFNFPGMIPAAAITYGGMADQYGISSQLAIRD